MMLRRLNHDARGVTAIEFALLSPLFFGILFTLIDLSLYYANRSIIDKAVYNAARAVRVGTAYAAAGDRAAFEGALCHELYHLSCDAVSYSVNAFTELDAVVADMRLDAAGELSRQDYDLGAPGDNVVVTAAYSHRFLIPAVARLFINHSGYRDGRLSILSHIVLRNEPFPE